MKALSALRVVLVAVCGAAGLFSPTASAAPAEDAHWIWSPAQPKDKVPLGTCFFRKTFRAEAPEHGQVQITADDAYELYVNGRHVGGGRNWRQLDTYDITKHLVRGSNTIAVEASNTAGMSAGLVARVVVKQAGGTHETHSTDESWRTLLKEVPQWNKTALDDRQWLRAKSFGMLGYTLPWGNEVQLAGSSERFHVLPEFRVEWVIPPKKTGSLIAMTFNEFGQIIASREGGPLILVSDSNKDGVPDLVSLYCDQVKNCQGLLALNGNVYATGDGPGGTGLYLLKDQKRDGRIDQVEMLVKFDGPMGEHGPHGIALGPDGLLYVMVGNHGRLAEEPSPSSPYRHYYEGDLLQPRYEDPGGHAVGIRAPGGMVLRTDLAGKRVERFAGGLRNAYHLAFNRQGDLFTHDSDMEADLQTPWYRPNRVNHIIPGAELGWRSGWANWPDYWLDGLPASLPTGPGSPTGMVFYNHYRYPIRFHNAMFTCDWALGEINFVRMQPSGAGYQMRIDPFVQGTPLNVTSVAVGPDGWLYFCTGGRETEGGIYCVTWTGKVPPEVADMGSGIERAIRQPQIEAAWARQKVAAIKQEMGAAWDAQIVDAARAARRPAPQRIRALDLMQLFGPFPTASLLLELSSDSDIEVRAKATYLMGVYGDKKFGPRLEALLKDAHPLVRRQACHALVRAGHQAPVGELLNLLADADREAAFAARRALERAPVGEWKAIVLTDPRVRVFLGGSVALLTVETKRDVALQVLDRCNRMIRGEVQEADSPPGFISDQNFTDLLRVIQLALLQGELNHDDVPELCQALEHEYPSRDATINRELVRLLVHLQQGAVTSRLVEQLKSDIPQVEKLHIAASAPFLKEGWTSEQKLEMLRFYEQARTIKGGSSFSRYVEYLARDFFLGLDGRERKLVLENGTRWPTSALAVIARLPSDPGDETVQQLIVLDIKLKEMKGEAVDRLRMGIIAVLGRSGDELAMAHLRQVYEEEPARRALLAMGLAQAPDGENWPMLVRSLSILDGVAALEVVNKLLGVGQQPEQPEALRQAILLGLRLKDEGALDVVGLLEHWTGQEVSDPDDTWDEALRAWQDWFVRHYPDQPEPRLPVEPEKSKWTFQELLSFLHSPEGSAGDPQRGALVYVEAQCHKCHRFGDRGESMGPDLTTVSRRFHKKEILESIMFPSHVISDQYASKKVLTTDGRVLVGLVAQAGPDEIVVLLPSGEKTLLAKGAVEEMVPSKVSAMPEGLLDELTLEQIADLFAYLSQPPRENITSRRVDAKQ